MATNREPHDIHLVLITRLRNCPLIERPALETGSRESSIESLAKKYPPISSKATRIIVSIVTIYMCVCVCVSLGILSKATICLSRGQNLNSSHALCIARKWNKLASEKLVRRSSKIDRMLIGSNPKNRSSLDFIPRFNPRNNVLCEKVFKFKWNSWLDYNWKSAISIFDTPFRSKSSSFYPPILKEKLFFFKNRLRHSTWYKSKEYYIPRQFRKRQRIDRSKSRNDTQSRLPARNFPHS